MNWELKVLKQTARKLVSPGTTQSCVSLVDTVSSEDSQRSSRNSVQALHESRRCIPCTRFNTELIPPHTSPNPTLQAPYTNHFHESCRPPPPANTISLSPLFRLFTSGGSDFRRHFINEYSNHLRRGRTVSPDALDAPFPHRQRQTRPDQNPLLPAWSHGTSRHSSIFSARYD